ncbi:MAG TPA: efflux RND transporter periplasmic adaptor subunit [Gallionella sp.]|nr:MAG: efflux transporter periplasmic adaptor subunit [Gallionellales bacterium GWA2_54_124]OGT19973.1 MAG: efflux transporter periplasmic adaptor subunit [Gallionellales bacterium RIFOXYD12_FULL_53_10]HCI52587.1 efflux RND transporter periplasmic adaptor subunit [Gallionella sp.]
MDEGVAVKKLWLVSLLVMATGARAAEPVAVVEYRDVAQTYRAEGMVEATRQSTVSAQIGGRVKEVNFDVGDSVKKGQIILRIDERESAQVLAGSQAQVQQAQANAQNARLTYERSRQLLAQKFISQAALDKAQSDYKVAIAQAAASEAGAGQASLAHGYTAVVAPYSGVVSARMVELGEMVMPGKPLMTGFDPSEMRVVVSVPQYKIVNIGAHPEVMIEVPSLNRWIKAESSKVQPVADARTHSTQVRVYLPANEAGLYPGMFVRAHFVVGKVKKLVIPASAVLRRSEVVAAFVVDEKGAASLRQIRVGEAVAEGLIEVLSGLKAGEKVALDPVKAGMK